MAIQGIVSTLNDPESGAIPGNDLVHDLAVLSPSPNHLVLRASISVDSKNHVNIDALKSALQVYKDADFKVWLVLHSGIETRYQSVNPIHYNQAMPNASLGYVSEEGAKPDYLRNDYIEKYSLACVGTLKALGDVCPDTVFIFNEANLDGSSLKMGQVPNKPTSLSPEVFGALLATTARRIKDKCPLVKNILVGSLTCLIKYNTDPHGPWVGGYLKQALAYIAQYGIVAPYDFHSLSLNLEGVVTDQYAGYCAQALTDIMRDNKIDGQTVIGEWGLNNDDSTDESMLGTFTALDKHFSTMFLYCHTTLNMHSYGTTLMGIDANGTIYPRDHTRWYGRLKTFIEGKSS